MRLFVAAVALAALVLQVPTARTAEKSNLKVLYSGNIGSSRANDFMSFLKKNFAIVGAVQETTFQESDCELYDVVIFDWTSNFLRDKDGKLLRDMRGHYLQDLENGASICGHFRHFAPSKKYSRASILIGIVGSTISGRAGLK